MVVTFYSMHPNPASPHDHTRTRSYKYRRKMMINTSLQTKDHEWSQGVINFHNKAGSFLWWPSQYYQDGTVPQQC